MSSAYSQAQSDLLVLELELAAQDQLLQSKAALLANNGVSDISISGPSSDVPLSDRFESVTENLKRAQSLLSQEKQIQKQKLRLHLSISYSFLEQARTAYSSIDKELDLIDKDLDALVASHASAAEELMVQANAKRATVNSRDFVSAVEQAQAALSLAQDETKTRGERISAYRKAIGFLNSALGATQPTQAEISSLESQSLAVRALLDAARIDGLPVDSLEAQYALATDPLTPSSVEALARIQDQVVLLARIKYGYLEPVRINIFKTIRYGGSQTQDLAQMMNSKSSYFDSEGRLILPLAVGHLVEIKSLFDEVESDLGQNIGDIIRGGIEFQTVEQVPLFELDSPVQSQLRVSIINSQDTQGRNFDISIPLKYPLRWLTQDIMQGRNRVSLVDTSKGVLTITVIEILPYESIDLVFEHTAIFAHTLKKEEVIVAAPDASALQTITTDFELDVPSRYAFASDLIQIDGASSRRVLEPGKHRMVESKTLAQAYSVSFGEPHVETGLASAIVDEEITVVAKTQLSKASVALPVPAGARDISILSKSGHVFSKPTGGGVQYVTDVSDISVDRPAIMLLRYTVPSLNASIQSQATEILSRTNSSAVKILVTEALSALQEKDALALLSKARNALIKEEQETANLKARYDSLYATYNSEKGRLVSFMETMRDSPDDPFVRAVAKRIESIDSALTLPVPLAVDALESLDKKWEPKQVKALLSQSAEMLSSLKKSIKANSIDPREALPVENALKVLEFSGSIEDVPELLNSLSTLTGVVLEGSTNGGRETLLQEFRSIESEYSSAEQFYESTCRVLQETPLRTLCSLDTSSSRKTLRDAQVALSNDGASTFELSDKMSKSRKAVGKFVQFKKDIADLSSKSALNLASLFDSRKDTFSKENQERFKLMLSRIEAYNKNGEYAQGLMLGLELSKALKDAPKDDSSLVMLALGALVVLGIVAFFLLRQKGKPHVALKPLKRISREQ